MPLAAAILMVSGIRAQVFSVLLGGRGGDYLDVHLQLLGLSESPRLSAFWIIWMGCARDCGNGVRVFRDAGVFEWPYVGHDIGGRGSRRGHRISSLEFQAAKIFMGDGGAMFLGFLMATLGLKLRLEHASQLSSCSRDSDSGRHHLRHDAGDDFTFATGTASLCDAGEGPRGAPPVQSGARPSWKQF